jgi:hypothetical protein
MYNQQSKENDKMKNTTNDKSCIEPNRFKWDGKKTMFSSDTPTY